MLQLAPIAASLAIKTVSGLFGGSTADADPVRLAANQRAFEMARTGNQDAINYLRGRAGGLGRTPYPVPVGAIGIDGTPGNIGGWAGTVGRPDAAAKLEALGVTGDTTNTVVNASPINAELQRLEDEYRRSTAEAISRIGSGATAAAANAVGGATGPTYQPAPITTQHLVIGAVILAAVLYLASHRS